MTLTKSRKDRGLPAQFSNHARDTQRTQLLQAGYTNEFIDSLTERQASQYLLRVSVANAASNKQAKKQKRQARRAKVVVCADEELQHLFDIRSAYSGKPREWYALYLKTEHWKKLRLKVMGRAGYVCSTCGSSEKLQVHHKTYDRIGQEELSDLICLCTECHQKEHGLA